MTNTILDATGHLCPIPVLKVRRAMEALISGDSLVMIATDFGAKKDVPNFCEQNGHILSSVQESEGTLTFTIIKG